MQSATNSNNGLIKDTAADLHSEPIGSPRRARKNKRKLVTQHVHTENKNKKFKEN